MSLDTIIKDGKGRANKAFVEDDGSLLITGTQVPPENFESVIRPFRQYITDDGTSAGSNDMRVNGSSCSVDFYIKAPSDGDRYIDTISIVIADQGAALNQFGSITALSNGVEIFYEDPDLGNVTIADGLTSNFEFARFVAGGIHGIGSGASSYRANNVSGNSEGYLFYLDISNIFGIPWGIRLRKDTTLRFVVRINDNTSAVDQFNMIAYGFDRIIK